MPFKIKVASAGLVRRPSLSELITDYLADQDAGDAHTVTEIMIGIGWMPSTEDFSATMARLSRLTRLQVELGKLVEEGRLALHHDPETGEPGYSLPPESDAGSE